MATLKSKTAGFNLLEMLVALLVISVGLLGVTSLQLKGQQTNYRSYVRTQATYLANDLMERMRTNKLSKNGIYEKACGATTTNCDSSPCSWDQVAEYDLARWCDMVKNSLPEGEGTVKWNDPQYTFEIKWKEKEDEDPKTAKWAIIP
jgi:type IV pilus assembly protein PilV